MAKKTTTKAKPIKKSAAKSPKKPVNSSVKRAPSVRVKTSGELVQTLQNQLAYNLHDRFEFSLSKKTKARIVAYGPWLALLFVVFISPQLLNLAKNNSLLTISGFFNQVFFNQDAWVILIIILLSTLTVVDGLTDLFEKKQRGWNRIYAPALVSTAYILWQLFEHLNQPAAPLLSLILSWGILFTLLDIREYYK